MIKGHTCLPGSMIFCVKTTPIFNLPEGFIYKCLLDTVQGETDYIRPMSRLSFFKVSVGDIQISLRLKH